MKTKTKWVFVFCIICFISVFLISSCSGHGSNDSNVSKNDNDSKVMISYTNPVYTQDITNDRSTYKTNITINLDKMFAYYWQLHYRNYSYGTWDKEIILLYMNLNDSPMTWNEQIFYFTPKTDTPDPSMFDNVLYEQMITEFNLS